MSLWRWFGSLWRARPPAGSVAEEGESRVLELRIHGLKNTPPGVMLGVDESAVARERGDALGGFWAEKIPSAPPGIHREAYSWGAMARSGGSTFAGLGQLFVHIGWLLLMPFGLCNVAYWTRRIPPQDARKSWRAGVGAPGIRLFALGLTLLFTTAVASVSIDLVGLQCYQHLQGLCSGVPAALDAVAGSNRELRLAILALIPLLGVLGLYGVARRARVRYRAGIDRELATPERERATATPLLATRGFWTEARVGSVTERLHFAAALSLLAALLAWDHIFGPVDGCTDPLTFIGAGCFAPGGALGTSLAASAVLAVAFAALTVTCVLIATGSSTSVNERSARMRAARARWVLALSALAFLATGLVTALAPAPVDRAHEGFVGLVATPVMLLGVMGALSIAGLGWRRGVPVSVSTALLVASLAIPLARLVFEPVWQWGSEHPEAWFAATAAVVAAQLALAVVWPWRNRGSRRSEAWAGAAPGVVMLISLGAAMVLSSIVVIGASFAFALPLSTPVSELSVSVAYIEFGVALLGVIIAAAALLVVVVLWQLPALLAPFGGSDSLAIRLTRARRRAALLHRAEPAVGLLAAITGLGLAVTIAAIVPSRVVLPGEGAAPSLALAWLDELAHTLAIFTLSGTALIALLVIAVNVFTTKERPIGLLWDIICFLPRAGHPFAPPCYAERVVPEVNERVREWLKPGEHNGRRVILSAHSLGAVLAVSSVFALHSTGSAPLSRVGMLSYGTQLRPYFGRLFPELLGPAILGTQSSRAPSLFGRNPWAAQLRADAAGAEEKTGAGSSTSLVTLLSRGRAHPAWINLWRPTDFLGMPACSYEDNDIDRVTAELIVEGSRVIVATHFGYSASEQYDASFAELLRRLG